MRDTEFECMSHGWRSTYQVCPFCLNGVLESDLKKSIAEVKRLEKELAAFQKVGPFPRTGE